MDQHDILSRKWAQSNCTFTVEYIKFARFIVFIQILLRYLIEDIVRMEVRCVIGIEFEENSLTTLEIVALQSPCLLPI